MSDIFLRQIEKVNARVMASDPWRTIDNSLESLIDKVVLEFNPQTLDDDIPDTLDDWDNRVEAIDYLVEKLLKIKEGN